MILLVDIGNSRIKWAHLYAGKRSQQFAQDYSQKTADVILLDLLKDDSRIKQLVLISVLDAAFVQKITGHCEKLGVELQVIGSQAAAYGIKNAYDVPKYLGADRFVGLVAAHQLMPNKHCIIISCGTAITIDAISVTGQHLGGLILPGLRSFSDDLIKKAALLSTPTTPKTTLFAKNTADAINGGRIYGLVEAINGISSRMKGELVEINNLEESINTMIPVQTILCGGDAKLIHHYLSNSAQREDDWLMQGLQFIAESKFPLVSK